MHLSSAFRQSWRSTPTIHAHHWAFSIGGRVQHPLILSLANLYALPLIDLDAFTLCAGAGTAPSPHTWRGVALPTLLDEVTLLPGTANARILAADGYTTTLSLAALQQAVLCLECDSAPLTPEDGFPARLVLPGHYGYKQPKWITRIELTDIPVAGLWEARGWPLDGVMQAGAIFTTPRDKATFSRQPVLLSGVAWAGTAPLAQVEISIDGGAWMPADHTVNPVNVLAQWQIEWMPPMQGDYRLAVRAADADGQATKPHALTLLVR